MSPTCRVCRQFLANIVCRSNTERAPTAVFCDENCRHLTKPTMPPKGKKKKVGTGVTATSAAAAVAADAAAAPADAATAPAIEPYFGASGEATSRATSLPRLPGF